MILLAVGCASTGSSPPDRILRKPAAPPETQLLLLNVAEASGWVAYGAAGQETQKYRIVVSREDNGLIIYESQVYLSDKLETHGFEMAEDDARLMGIARQVDTGILAPLRKAALDAAPPPDSTETPREAPPSPPINTLEGVEVVSADADGMILRQTTPDLLAPGDRIFLRTPPEYIEDVDGGAPILVSRGRVAALLEVTAIEGDQVTLVRRSGEIPLAGYLEKAVD